MAQQEEMTECSMFTKCLCETYSLYFQHGSRSSKKVDHFHGYIKSCLETVFLSEKGFSVKLEQNIPSVNSSGRKKCDIVVFKNTVPYIVLPVKLIMTNYKQNKNNSWENLTGELIHLKWANPNLHIVPINVFMNRTPYLKQSKKIDKFEHITYTDIQNYEILKEKGIAYDFMNYIINVEHVNNIGDEFNIMPQIIDFNESTPFKPLSVLFNHLLEPGTVSENSN